MWYCLVLAMSRATCRASSCSSRVMDRASMLGQHFAFDGQLWHIGLSARYLCRTFPCRPLVGIRVVAAELFQLLTFRADVLVVLSVPFKVGSGPGAIGAARDDNLPREPTPIPGWHPLHRILCPLMVSVEARRGQGQVVEVPREGQALRHFGRASTVFQTF